MNVFKNLCFVAIIAFIFTSCKNETQLEVKTVNIEAADKDVSKVLDPNAIYAKVEFGIEGMTCAIGCAKTIEKKMAKMEGVKSAKVDFDKRLAMVEYDEAKVTPKSLEETVTKTGDVYKVIDMKKVEGFASEKKLCEAKCEETCSKKGAKSKEDCSEACKKACADKAMKSK